MDGSILFRAIKYEYYDKSQNYLIYKMEWSKEKTMKLIELLQVNASLWNPSLCDTRRDKQKRREELRNISEVLEVYVADVTRKIQHLRTQYNRESARETRAKFESPDDKYVSSWYAFEYLHFLKDSNKPYRVVHSQYDESSDGNTINTKNDRLSDCKPTPPHKISRMDSSNTKPDTYTVTPISRDDLSVFGEYVANELRSVKCEKTLLVAKKKILDVIFEVKMGDTCKQSPETNVCEVFTNSPNQNTNSLHSDKVFMTPLPTSQIEPLTNTHTAPATGINEIIIESACHYSNFKVDNE